MLMIMYRTYCIIKLLYVFIYQKLIAYQFSQAGHKQVKVQNTLTSSNITSYFFFNFYNYYGKKIKTSLVLLDGGYKPIHMKN
jgi:hypothetical protein